MLTEISKKINWIGKELSIKTGKIARQTDGAAWVSWGKTVVLATVVVNKDSEIESDFFPLSVHYREMYSAAGKIPGGFVKREGKSSEKEILTSRLIDRAVRPLFTEGFKKETQIICNVLSYEEECSPDVVAMVATSAALALSGLPIKNIFAAAHVSYIENKFKINVPPLEQLNSDLDLVVAGTENYITMVEAQMNNFSEEKTLEAIELAQKEYQPVIDVIQKLQSEVSVTKIEHTNIANPLLENITSQYEQIAKDALFCKDKKTRNSELKKLYKNILEQYPENLTQANEAFKDLKSSIMRHNLIQNNVR